MNGLGSNGRTGWRKYGQKMGSRETKKLGYVAISGCLCLCIYVCTCIFVFLFSFLSFVIVFITFREARSFNQHAV